jgi:hypothetical protein
MSEHESFNRAIRVAARGNLYNRRHDALDVAHVGSIGVGRGGAAASRPLRPDPAAHMNQAIREAGWRVKHRVDAGGVDLDDLLGRR